jgi:DNA-binding NarL/FixJ family response regulator
MKTVIVEDSELIQAHLLRLLGQQPRVELVGVAADEEHRPSR